MDDLIFVISKLRHFCLNMKLRIKLLTHTIINLVGKWRFLIRGEANPRENNQCILEGLVNLDALWAYQTTFKTPLGMSPY